MSRPIDLHNLKALAWHLWDKHGCCEDAAVLLRAAARELRELRSFRDRLGPPETWFPSLNGIDQWARADLCELVSDAEALIRRAKENE